MDVAAKMLRPQLKAVSLMQNNVLYDLEAVYSLEQSGKK